MRKTRTRLFQNACSIACALGALSILAVACGSDTKTLQGLPTTNAGASQPVQATTQAPPPTVAPAASLELLGKGFYMTERFSGGFYVQYAFTVRNSDTKNALARNSYQVSVFDADNKPLGSDSGYVSLVLPGETSAKAGSITVSSRAARIEVAVSKGASEDAKNLKPLALPGDARYEPAPRATSSGKVVATIANPYGTDLKDLQTTAILYDAGGAIIGGGFTFLQLLPANGSSVASISIDGVPPAPAKVVVYPGISSLTILDLQKR